MTNGTEAGRGSVLIIAEQNADLKLDEVERRGVNAIRAGSSDKLDIAPLGEGEDCKRLALRIDEPIEGNAMIRIDAALGNGIAATSIAIAHDLTDPVWSQLDGIAADSVWHAFPTPSSRIRLNHLMRGKLNRRFCGQPPAARPRKIPRAAIEDKQAASYSTLRCAVLPARKRLFDDLAVENLVTTVLLWDEEEIGKSREMHQGSVRRSGIHTRNLALGWLAVKSLGRRQDGSVRCVTFAVRKPARSDTESDGHALAGIDAGKGLSGFRVRPRLDTDTSGRGKGAHG